MMKIGEGISLGGLKMGARKLPPGPRGALRGFRELGRMRNDLLATFVNLHKEYGDTVHIKFGPYDYYTIFHPDAIRELLVTQQKSFHKAWNVRTVLRQWNGDGLLLSEGQKWLQQRRMVQPAFSPKRFGKYAELMVDRTQAMIDRWSLELHKSTSESWCGDSPANDSSRSESPNSKKTARLDVGVEMTDLALEIIAATMFSAKIEDEASDLREAVGILSELAVDEMQQTIRLPDWLPLPSKRRKRWALRVLKETVAKFIRQRRESGEDRGDLLSMLMLAADDDGDGKKMSDEQAHNEATTLLLAGHDTSASGLMWAIYNLAMHPAAQEEAAEEVLRTLGDRPPTFEDAANLPYVEMFLQESMRLYPPAEGVFLRQAIEDVELGGYKIKKGALIQTLSYVTHRDERWFPDAEKFDPLRFTNEAEQSRPQFAYFPFGGGPRVCIGNTFAMLEMKLVIAMLLQKFRFSMPADQKQPELKANMSLQAADGIEVRYKARTRITTAK